MGQVKAYLIFLNTRTLSSSGIFKPDKTCFTECEPLFSISPVVLSAQTADNRAQQSVELLLKTFIEIYIENYA